MERRAAVDYLLRIAEKSNNSKYSAIVNDLARRVALSIEDNNINLEKFCSKMAAELMFRDDYANANRLMKLAQDATPNPDDLLPLDNNKPEQSEQPVEPNAVEQDPFIQNNLPQQTKPIMPPLDKDKLKKFMEDIEKGGAAITTKTEEESKDPDDSKNNQNQMVEDPNPPTEPPPVSLD
jgi:hypothetical protein